MITLLIRCCHLVVHYEGECVLEPAQACISVSIENSSLCGVKMGRTSRCDSGNPKIVVVMVSPSVASGSPLVLAVLVEYEAPAMWIYVVFPQFEQFEVLRCGRRVELMADQ